MAFPEACKDCRLLHDCVWVALERVGFLFHLLLVTSLPEEFRTAMEIVSLCTSIPIYFTLSIDRVVLSGGVRADTQKRTPKGGALL